MNKAVFLDRDGTINVEKNYLHKINEFEFCPGAIEGMKLLQEAGFKLIIITNQSGIGRGYYTEEAFLLLNKWMIDRLQREGVIIDKVYYCPHLPNAAIEKYRKMCNCRKPLLGLYEKAIKEFNLRVDSCYAIGDKIRDCKICEVTDCKGFLISNNEKKIIDVVITGKYKNIRVANDLLDAAKKIIVCEGCSL